MIKLSNVVVSLITSILVVFIGITSAVSSTAVRIKSAPDVYQLSPTPLPQIPLRVFYEQRLHHYVESESGFLTVINSEFALPERDGINLPLDRRYSSGSALNGVSGKGWVWAFESHISVIDENQIAYIGLNGQRYIFNKVSEHTYASYNYGEQLLKETANGYVLSHNGSRYSYNPAGQLEQIAGVNGGVIDLVYNDQVLQSIDYFGRISINLEYDAAQRLSHIVLPSGHRIGFSYENDQLTTVTDVFGRSQHYQYNDNQLLAHIRYSDDLQLDFRYADTAGVIAAIDDGSGVETSYTFEKNADSGLAVLQVSKGDYTQRYETSAAVWRYIDENQQTTEVERDARFPDLPARLISASGRTLNYFYDKYGQLLEIKDADGNSVNYTYDDNKLISITYPRGAKIALEYDDKRNITQITDARGQITRLGYTDLGQLGYIVEPDGETTEIRYYSKTGLVSRVLVEQGGSEEKQELRYDYDQLLRLRKEWLDNELLAEYQYDNQNQQLTISRLDGNVWTRISYNDLGLPKQIESMDGKQTEYSYSALGQLLAVTEADESPFKMQYDVFGNLSQVTLPDGQQHQYEYTPQGWLSALIDPESNRLSYKYDADGRLLQQQLNTSSNQIVNYAYDNLGRTQSIATPNGDKTQLHYNSDDAVILARRDNTRTQIARGVDNEPRIYSIIREDENGIEIEHQYQMTWDIKGRLASLLYPSGMLVEYEYYEDDRIASIEILGKGKINYEYEGDNTTIVYPNGVQSVYQGQSNYLTQLNVTNAEDASLVEYVYAYDVNGNLIGKQYQYGEDEAVRRFYQYDSANRLQTIADEEQIITQYAYDAMGNRLSTQTPDNTRQYSYQNNRLVQTGDNRYQYDAAGNLLQRDIDGEQQTLRYSARDELLQVSTKQGSDTNTVSYQYDGFGQRSAKQINDETIYTDFVFGHRLLEKSLSGNDSREYIYAPGIDQLIAVNMLDNTQQDATYFYHQDRNSSVVLLTDESGNTANEYVYGAFGETVLVNENIDNPFRYTGRYKETNTNLYDFRTRFYDPSIGRFISEDKYPAFAGVPASYNRYAYVFNNPTKYRDPNGEFLHIAVGAAIGATVGVVANGVSNYASGKPIFQGAGRAALQGGVAGGVGVATAGVGVVGSALITSASSTAVGAGHDLGTGNLRSPIDYISEFGYGAAGGAAGGYISRALSPRIPSNTFKPTWMRSPNSPHDVGIGTGTLRQQLSSLGRFSNQTRNQLIQMTLGAKTGSGSSMALGALGDSLQDEAERDAKEEDAAEQDEAEQDKAEQDAKEEDAAEQDEAEQNAKEEDAADEDEAEQDEKEEDAADEDKAEQDAKEEDAAEQDEAEQNAKEEDAADEDEAESDAKEEDVADEDAKEEDAADQDAKEQDEKEADEKEEEAKKEDAADQDAKEEDSADEDEAERDAKEEDEAERQEKEQAPKVKREKRKHIPKPEAPDFIWRP